MAKSSTLRWLGDLAKGTFKPVPNAPATEKKEVRIIYISNKWQKQNSTVAGPGHSDSSWTVHAGTATVQQTVLLGHSTPSAANTITIR